MTLRKHFALLACIAAGTAFAKLPPMDEVAKAKAAETAAKTGWQSKVDAYLLCKSQDRIAAYYRKTAASLAGQAGQAAAATPGGAPAATTPGTVGTASAPALTASAAQAAPAAAGTATRVAGAPTPTGCADPGPFAYNPAPQTPLESSGAHSPAGNAASPPSVAAPAAAMNPSK